MFRAITAFISVSCGLVPVLACESEDEQAPAVEEGPVFPYAVLWKFECDDGLDDWISIRLMEDDFGGGCDSDADMPGSLYFAIPLSSLPREQPPRTTFAVGPSGAATARWCPDGANSCVDQTGTLAVLQRDEDQLVGSFVLAPLYPTESEPIEFTAIACAEECGPP